MYDARVDFTARPPLVTGSGPRLLARSQYSQKREHGGADVDPIAPASAAPICVAARGVSTLLAMRALWRPGCPTTPR